jgi:hypothetical protein
LINGAHLTIVEPDSEPRDTTPAPPLKPKRKSRAKPKRTVMAASPGPSPFAVPFTHFVQLDSMKDGAPDKVNIWNITAADDAEAERWFQETIPEMWKTKSRVVKL